MFIINLNVRTHTHAHSHAVVDYHMALAKVVCALYSTSGYTHPNLLLIAASYISRKFNRYYDTACKST